MANQTFENQTTQGATTPPDSNGELLAVTDTRDPVRFGLWVLGIGLGGFLLWAALAPLDEGVPTRGLVSIETKRKTVQHQTGGIVKEVLVKEGQYVEMDQPLLVIDDALQKADYAQVRQTYFSLRASEARLLAEQGGQQKLRLHPDLEKHQDDPLVRQLIDNQRSLFESRRKAYEAEQQAIRENIQALQASIDGYEGMLSSKKAQLEYAREELNGIRELVKEGYAPRNRQLELERQAADYAGSIADLQGNILRARSSIAEMRMRASQRTQEYRKETDEQLAAVRREVDADAEKFSASSKVLARTVIRAPVAGQVVGLNAQTVGGVLAAGQKLMDIVPQNEFLLLEARVPPTVIDRVLAGQKADIRFDTFAHSPSLVVEGNVNSVSTDLVTDETDRSTFYLARVAITGEGMKILGNRQLQAGMPATVIIKTGERTFLTYLLHPLIRRLAASLKEE